MTSIHTYDPASGSGAAELPPMTIGTWRWDSSTCCPKQIDLPQPRYITHLTTARRASTSSSPRSRRA